MTLDVPTLFTCLMIAEFAGSAILLLFFMFWKSRGSGCSDSLLLWSTGLFLIGFGTVLLARRGEISDDLSIVAANAFILTGALLRRSGFAAFLNLRRHYLLAIMPAVVWVALCSYPPFRESLIARVNFLYLFLGLNCAWMVWAAFCKNREKLYSVRLLGVTMLIEGAAFLWYTLHQNLLDFPTFLSAFPERFVTVYLLLILFSNIMTFVLPASMVIERKLLRFKEQALQDPLTGLPNRRAFLDSAESWISDRKRAGETYSVILMDLDGFKSINDTFGNAMGDAVLRLMGRVLKDTIGEKAVPGRIGGEEFVVFLPGCDKELAILTAQRICRKFGGACQEASQGKLLVTTGVGLVTTQSRVSLERAMEVADQGLYQAKKQGRAQVVAMNLTPGGRVTRSPEEAGFSFPRRKVA